MNCDEERVSMASLSTKSRKAALAPLARQLRSGGDKPTDFGVLVRIRNIQRL